MLLAAALIVVGKRLVVTEELEEDYPPRSIPRSRRRSRQIVEREREPLHAQAAAARRAAGAAGAALGAALITPALSLGPWLDTEPL